MIKQYFGKFSWVDPTHVMLRIHKNAKLYLDLTKGEYDIIVAAKNNFGYTQFELNGFTIDFLIECEEE